MSMKTRFVFWLLTREAFSWFRDRLRCPTCKSIGTWKPHLGTPGDPLTPDRWLCKWCGIGWDHNGKFTAYISAEHGCWRRTRWLGDDQVVEAWTRRPIAWCEKANGAPVSPWKG